MSKNIKLSNGHAEVKDFISARVDNGYQAIIRSGMANTSSYALTAQEEKEMEALPLAERIKVKQALAPSVDVSVVDKGQKYLMLELIEKLVVEEKELRVSEDTLLDLPRKDYNLLAEECYNVYKAEQEELEDKKK